MTLSTRIEIRGWRVRQEQHGLQVFFDPSYEHLQLHSGPESAQGAREGSEAEAGRAVTQNQIDAECVDPLQFALFMED